MSEKNKNQKNKIVVDLIYLLRVSKKGFLWWKKPIYGTKLSVPVGIVNGWSLNPIIGEIYDIDDNLKEKIYQYIDNKLEELGIFSKNIISDNYRLNINSKWSNEELDKAIDNFVNKVIKYKF